MDSKINISSDIFNIPCRVVDELLKVATGEQLKVLLYIMRDFGKDVAEHEISDKTGVCKEDVTQAIDFWQRSDVLLGQLADKVIAIGITEPVDNYGNIPEENTRQHKKNYSAMEIAQLKIADPVISGIIENAENSFGILNNMQISSIINMYRYNGLNKEVIAVLLKYCKEVNRAYPQYMEDIASDWAENNIDTVETANQEAERLRKINEYINKVKRITSAYRFSPDDESLIAEWHKKDVSFQVIEEAYELTIKYIHKLNLKYMDTIINSRPDVTEDSNGKTGRKRRYKGKRYHYDDKFDTEKYKIFVNDYEVN